MTKMLFGLIVILIISLGSKAFALVQAEGEVPWSINKEEIFVEEPHSVAAESEEGFLQNILMKSVSFFQRVISPADGDRCSMYPTCSAYSMQALKKHGTVIGAMMTVDRLFHELEEQEYSPLIVKYGQYRFYDPIEYNDFWWDRIGEFK